MIFLVIGAREEISGVYVSLCRAHFRAVATLMSIIRLIQPKSQSELCVTKFLGAVACSFAARHFARLVPTCTRGTNISTKLSKKKVSKRNHYHCSCI